MDDNLQPPRRWDPIVKLTHWGIVAAVIGNALVTEEGSGWHIWVGYGLAGLLALRLLWGLIGPREARFSAFPPNPSRALTHLNEIGRGEVTRHPSHNPLGALMVYAIWGTLLVVIGSGIAMSGPPPANPSAVEGREKEGGEGREGGKAETEEEAGEARPPAVGAAPITPAAIATRAPREDAREEAREERGEREERAEAAARKPVPAAAMPDAIPAPVAPKAETAAEAGERAEAGEAGEAGEEDEAVAEVHEVAVNLLYLLIALHLMGVVFETRRSGREIVGAMLPGGSRRA